MSESERKRLEALEAAAKKFIDKVESGRAHSVETYTELKAAMAIGRAS